jgi:hypothetical protein
MRKINFLISQLRKKKNRQNTNLEGATKGIDVISNIDSSDEA